MYLHMRAVPSAGMHIEVALRDLPEVSIYLSL